MTVKRSIRRNALPPAAGVYHLGGNGVFSLEIMLFPRWWASTFEEKPGRRDTVGVLVNVTALSISLFFGWCGVVALSLFRVVGHRKSGWVLWRSGSLLGSGDLLGHMASCLRHCWRFGWEHGWGKVGLRRHHRYLHMCNLLMGNVVSWGPCFGERTIARLCSLTRIGLNDGFQAMR